MINKKYISHIGEKYAILDRKYYNFHFNLVIKYEQNHEAD